MFYTKEKVVLHNSKDFIYILHQRKGCTAQLQELHIICYTLKKRLYCTTLRTYNLFYTKERMYCTTQRTCYLFYTKEKFALHNSKEFLYVLHQRKVCTAQLEGLLICSTPKKRLYCTTPRTYNMFYTKEKVVLHKSKDF